MQSWLIGGYFGLVVVAVIRPWRLFWQRQWCPQCRQLLPRWDVWGWKEDWDCSHCGCRIE